MSIGEVLADARCQLGISVSEVSRRTRIRKAIIWGVEQDDYSVCAGDFTPEGISAPSPRPWGWIPTR